MIIATLSQEEIASILENLNGPATKVRIAFDPIDRAFKFKLDDTTWSPPLGTFQAPAMSQLRYFVTGLRDFTEAVVRDSRP